MRQRGTVLILSHYSFCVDAVRYIYCKEDLCDRGTVLILSHYSFCVDAVS